MVAALAMVACSVDELNVIEPEPEVGKEGYLMLSSLRINTDNETVDLGKEDITRDGMPTTMSIPNPNNISEVVDNYWIEVYSVAADGEETIVDINSANEDNNGIHYKELKELQKQTATGQNQAGIPLAPGSYVLKAYKTQGKKNDISDVIADVSGTTTTDDVPRAYYMGEKAFTVVSGEAVSVNVECKLANILTTVELAADLKKWFKDTTVGGKAGKEVKTTVTVSPVEGSVTGGKYIFPADSNHGVEDNYGKITSGGPFVYFKDFAAAAGSNKGNTLTIELEGKYFNGSESEMANAADNDPKWIDVSMKKTLTDVRAAQWRQISIDIDRKTTGDVTFEITINSNVYDDDIDVDVVTTYASLNLGKEEEVDDVGTENPNAPSVVIRNDSDLTYNLMESMFDEFGNVSGHLTVDITPTTGSTVAAIWAVVDGTDALGSALASVEAYEDGRIDLFPTNEVSTYCQVITAGTAAQLCNDAMKALKNYIGEHTVSVYTKDSEGRQKHTDIIIKVEGSGTAPVITGPTSNFFETVHQLTADRLVEGSTNPFVCYANITSSAPGFTSFDVDILIPGMGQSVADMFNGVLDEETDIATISLTDVDPDYVEALREVTLLPTDKSTLEGEMEAVFDVSGLMVALYGVVEKTCVCEFTVSVGNAYGTTTKTIKINVVK